MSYPHPALQYSFFHGQRWNEIAAGAYRELLSETELLSAFFDKQKNPGFLKLKPIVRDTNQTLG